MMTAKCFSLDKNKIEIDERELARRLGIPSGSDMSQYMPVIERVKNQAMPKCCYCEASVQVYKNEVTFDFATIESADLAKCLDGCDRAVVFAITLGQGADRHLLALSKTSPAEHYIADAVASALAEAVCDKAQEILRDNRECRPRYSVGYGDCDIAYQKDILNFLCAEKYLGIVLSDSYLMTPQKSITAILGIKKEEQK